MVHPAKTIDEVITQLQAIIEIETKANSSLAYFPVLYLKVTQRIKVGIQRKEFENNERMSILDVLFANRYIKAYNLQKEHKEPTQSWIHAFEAAKDSKLLIMQHLLLGINAHINLDLGVAVAETVGVNGDLSDFQNDFNKINEILASMVDDIQERIGQVSPLFYLLEKIGKGREDKVVSFSINLARDGAWLFANQYHHASDKESEILVRDTIIAVLATKLYTTKSRWLRWTIRSIRWLEQKNVPKVVAILET